MSNPVITVKNHSSRDIFVDGDPDWDDQVLKIDGNPIDSVYTMPKGSVIQVSVDWNGPGNELMMGVIFANAANYDYGDAGFYQLSIGQEPQTGNLGVTDGDSLGPVLVRYMVEDQAPWSMSMIFIDP